MHLDPTAFERYRNSPTEKTTLPRMIIGVVIVAILWFGTTMAVIFGGYAWLLEGPLDEMMGTTGGLFTTLASFAGIWIGLWVAMRWLHREPVSRLFGNSGRISRSGFLRGFAAVAVTSLLTELAYFAMMPDVARGSVTFGAWLLLLVPMTIFAYIQTSSEEVLFRGYLQRGLAYRFRSAIVWGVLPTIAFTLLHWSPQSVLAMNVAVVMSIGAFAALLALLVYATGNLGAAMGAHLGNNLIGFALISHDRALGGLALFQGPPLDSLAWTLPETALIVGISLVSIALTWLLLLHPRSPLRVPADPGQSPAPGRMPGATGRSTLPAQG